MSSNHDQFWATEEHLSINFCSSIVCLA
jgi:hypothetical protein